MVRVNVRHDPIVIIYDFDIVLQHEFPPCVEPAGRRHTVPPFVFRDSLRQGFGLAGEEVVEFKAGLVDQIVFDIEVG